MQVDIPNVRRVWHATFQAGGLNSRFCGGPQDRFRREGDHRAGTEEVVRISCDEREIYTGFRHFDIPLNFLKAVGPAPQSNCPV